MADKSIFQLNISDPEGFHQQFKIPLGITTIGRQSINSLQFDHSRVSRRHASLKCTRDECQLTDLGSSNGTYIDGERLAPDVPVRLSHGVTINIGPFIIIFEKIPVEVRQEESPQSVERIGEKPAAIKLPPETITPLPPTPPHKISPDSKDAQFHPGLSKHSERLWRYLPGLYHTDFMKRFLAIFESILTPIEWTLDNFDLFLGPSTALTEFLPWLANWYEITFDATWREEQRRALLSEAHKLYARRGTKWALSRVLEIYTGLEPEIDDTNEALEAFTFVVKFPVRQRDVNRRLIEAIIDANKPAHTVYTLKFAK